jgi:hypothetical protein
MATFNIELNSKPIKGSNERDIVYLFQVIGKRLIHILALK